jgi:hypothetical protein
MFGRATRDRDRPFAPAQHAAAAVDLVIGFANGSLISGVAARSIRSRVRRDDLAATRVDVPRSAWRS